MSDLPTGWGALCAVVFLLGMRHGLDADHLATIDGLTRLTHRERSGWARYCGALFSLGHGAVVLAIAGSVGALSERWVPPAWVDAAGAWVSIGFLFVLGVANLHATLAAPPGGVVELVGIKGALFGRIVKARSPWAVAGVGALFALSFDTMSQAALFAVTAASFGGIGHALTLGALFVAGMVLTDGLNGWWVAHLIRRADDLAARASCVMSLAVATVSLLVAALGTAKLLSPVAEQWSEGKELGIGLGVIALIALSYAVSRIRFAASGVGVPSRSSS